MEIKTVITMDYDELEKIIFKAYNQKFCFVADNELGNDSSWNRAFDLNCPLEDYEVEELEKFKLTGKGDYLTNTIMQDMVNNNVIPSGEYLISVSW